MSRWPISTSLIFTAVTNEFRPSHPPLLTLSQNIGLLFGAVFWGFGCDIFGRRWAFNLTIGITSVFGLVAAGSPSFAAIGVFAALWSVGVGGNLPVDSAIFLEFLPGSHQYLLTVLSVDWAVAQLYATLIAWPLLGNMTCQEKEVCTREENMGWRYFLIVMVSYSLLFLTLYGYISQIPSEVVQLDTTDTKTGRHSPHHVPPPLPLLHPLRVTQIPHGQRRRRSCCSRRARSRASKRQNLLSQRLRPASMQQPHFLHFNNSSAAGHHRRRRTKTKPPEGRCLTSQSPLRNQETRLLHLPHHHWYVTPPNNS